MNDSSSDGRLAGGITRAVLERDGIRDTMRSHHPEVPLIAHDDVRASVRDTLRLRPAAVGTSDGVWVFGYGSLLWNPCVNVVERRLAQLYGFHRDFQLKLTYARGSPDAPGLMLGLVPGGSCRGMALRVRASDLEHELLMVWRREMLTGVYRPRWVELHADGRRLSAVTFVVDPGHRCYCGRLDDAEIVRLIATGHGFLGTSAEYLDNTVVHLDEQGIHDGRLQELRRRVIEQQTAAR